MSDSVQTILNSAFEMIEAGHPDRAVTLLQPLLTQAADNPDVWWVYAHAVTDPQVAHAALTRVLRLEPAYPEAVSLLRQLEKQLRKQRASLLREHSSASSLSSRPVAALQSDIPPQPDFPEMPGGVGGGSFLGGVFHFLLVIVAVGMIGVVAIVVLGPQLSGISPVATQSPIIRTWVPTQSPSSTSTPTPTATPTPIPTSTPTPSTPIGNVGSASLNPEGPLVTTLLAAVPDFELRPNTELLREAVLGPQMVISVCGSRGDVAMVEKVQNALVSLCSVSQDLPTTIHTLAIEVLDCETGSVLTVIGVERNTAQKFAMGGLTERALRARFRPLIEG